MLRCDEQKKNVFLNSKELQQTQTKRIIKCMMEVCIYVDNGIENETGGGNKATKGPFGAVVETTNCSVYTNIRRKCI
jgi:hypothetical protein